jgi:hypothetical protein
MQLKLELNVFVEIPFSRFNLCYRRYHDFEFNTICRCISDYEICDDTSGETEIFDLSTKDEEVFSICSLH